MRRAWLGVLGCGPIVVAGCNLVVGIEDVTEGTACSEAAECPSPDEACTVAACDIGVCGFATAPDGAACGKPGETCAGGACECPLEHRCGTDETCFDLGSDPKHCGACDRECGAGETCVDAECACPARNQCGDACIDTSTTSTDCGACGHDCGGAACREGLCEPEVIADGVGSVVAMTVDGEDLFYASETGAIGRVSLGSLESFTLTDGGPFGPYGIAADQTSAYFTSIHPDFDGLFAVPRAGGEEVALASPEENPTELERIEDTLLILTAGGIRSFVLPDGPIETLVAASGIKSFGTDGGDVFYAVGDRVERAPIGGGPSAVLARGLVAPSAIAIDPSSVYVVSSATSGDGTGAIVRIDRESGAAETIATSLTDPRSVVADGDWIYVTDHIGLSVLRIGKTGGDPIPLAAGFDPSAPVAVAGSYVVVADATHGRIVRIAR